MNRSSQWALSAWLLILVSTTGQAQDKPDTPAVPPEPPAAPVITLTDKWTVLVDPGRPQPGIVEFTEKSPIQNVPGFKLVGPMVGHPFGLGEFIVDGHWAMAQGVVQVVEGKKNSLLSLATADQFELEGIIHQEGSGGWLILLGWNQGHGYSLSNVSLINSGAPWFMCEYRAAEAIPLTNNQIKKYDWKGNQPFRLIVKDKLLTVTVGQTAIVEEYPLDNYTAGEVFLGTYNTRYGARPLKIRSLRMRALVQPPEKPKKPNPPAKKKAEAKAQPAP